MTATGDTMTRMPRRDARIWQLTRVCALERRCSTYGPLSQSTSEELQNNKVYKVQKKWPVAHIRLSRGELKSTSPRTFGTWDFSRALAVSPPYSPVILIIPHGSTCSEAALRLLVPRAIRGLSQSESLGLGRLQSLLKPLNMTLAQ